MVFFYIFEYMFIRFGEIKKRSIIYDMGSPVGKERGLSVYYCDADDCINIDIDKMTDTTIDTVTMLFYNSIGCNPHPIKIYKVDGDVVGYGTDGEPLLTDVKMIKELSPKEMQKVRYDTFLEGYDDTLYPYKDGMLIIPLYMLYLQSCGINIKSFKPIHCEYILTEEGRFIKK